MTIQRFADDFVDVHLGEHGRRHLGEVAEASDDRFEFAEVEWREIVLVLQERDGFARGFAGEDPMLIAAHDAFRLIRIDIRILE